MANPNPDGGPPGEFLTNHFAESIVNSLYSYGDIVDPGGSSAKTSNSNSNSDSAGSKPDPASSSTSAASVPEITPIPVLPLSTYVPPPPRSNDPVASTQKPPVDFKPNSTFTPAAPIWGTIGVKYSQQQQQQQQQQRISQLNKNQPRWMEFSQDRDDVPSATPSSASSLNENMFELSLNTVPIEVNSESKPIVPVISNFRQHPPTPPHLKPAGFLPRQKNQDLYGPSGSFDFVGAASSAPPKQNWFDHQPSPSPSLQDKDSEVQRVQLQLSEAKLEIKRLYNQLDSIREHNNNYDNDDDQGKYKQPVPYLMSSNDSQSGSSSAGINSGLSSKWYGEDSPDYQTTIRPNERSRVNSISGGYPYPLSPSTRLASSSQPYITSTNSSATMNYDQFVPHIDDPNITAIAVASGLAEPNEFFYPIKYYNEPLNYRKLLERNVCCDWRLIIDRIVQDNDQQASIFLQQKLKSATKSQKSAIISAIVEQSYLLMINRFGNFLVQRCFEYGSSDEISGITQGMVGHIIQLAMDPFGCHVIQKTLDCVGVEVKHQIIEEMLCSVKETMVHRYASHVWQKLFELRWDGSIPPRFMRKVNLDLNGSWVEVSQTETGSLVVQNIFENCSDDDKRPCIDEIIQNLDNVIRGQWGNWVIQHMVEHAHEPYRRTVINMIIESAAVYSVDQFASKTVEKMLKMGDKDIIQAFLNKVIEKRPDRARIPLIDIASDGHGNYLIQYILLSGTPEQKETVSTHLKKHMVSLRGSKWGSKCAWLIDKNRSASSVGGLRGMGKDRYKN